VNLSEWFLERHPLLNGASKKISEELIEKIKALWDWKFLIRFIQSKAFKQTANFIYRQVLFQTQQLDIVPVNVLITFIA